MDARVRGEWEKRYTESAQTGGGDSEASCKTLLGSATTGSGLM